MRLVAGHEAGDVGLDLRIPQVRRAGDLQGLDGICGSDKTDQRTGTIQHMLNIVMIHNNMIQHVFRIISFTI